MSRRKGRRLAVSLPPRWPGSLLLATFVTGTFVGVLLSFLHFSGDDYTSGRAVLYTVGIGGLGLVCIVGWVREVILWSLAGDSAVEISHQPVSPGETIEYYILQGRDHSEIRQFQATLLCRRQKYYDLVETLVRVPLAASEIEPGGRRGMIKGSLCLPDGPPTTPPSDHIKVRWAIEIRITFGGKVVLKEDHPLDVANKKPPAV